MLNIISGAENLAEWALNERNIDFASKKYRYGVPGVKYIVTNDGQIHSVEYPLDSELNHPDILKTLGISVASLLLAGIRRFEHPHTAQMEIGSGTNNIYNQMLASIKANPGIVEDFKKSLEPHFPDWVTIKDNISPYIIYTEL